MKNIKIVFWGLLALLTLLWLLVDTPFPQPFGYFPLRAVVVQYSGILGISCMSVAMILALRPRWLEARLNGLDKMYRLHKWLGIGGLTVSILHWWWAKGTKWMVGWGWLERPVRGPRPVIDNPVEAWLGSLRGLAENLGEWTFYAAVVLIALALIHRFPYRLFYKTHRLLAVAYLVLVFHSVVLMKFSYWSSPIGWLMAVLLAYGTAAAVIVLLRRVGVKRQVEGKIIALTYYEDLRVLETMLDVPHGWPGHHAGQFAFATSNESEGAHPYTIASAWNAAEHHITFITKELGDHTRTLHERLKIGQSVKIEGPYGCFTFDDAHPIQIWIGGGIGITPFIARMKQLALHTDEGNRREIYFFHTTADYDEAAITKLKADAEAAKVHLQVLVGSRDGRLSGERIRATVPAWRKASIWFCGPAGFGQALRADFAVRGLAVAERFHQELFAMR